jgi:DNA-binding NtrC family response regulator
MDVAVQWVRAALDSARTIAGAEAILIGAAGGMLAIGDLSCGSPSSEDVALLASGGGRWLRVPLAHNLVMAALPAAGKERFSTDEQDLLQQVGATLFAPSCGGSLQDRIDAVERDAIAGALRKTAGNKARAARLLGITRGGLYLKMKRHRLE